MIDKIVCFGKNYADHIQEMGDASVDKPVIFLKPPSVLKQCEHWGETLQAVTISKEIHYECELVIQLNAGGYQMTKEEAVKAIQHYTIGLDMTLRKEQAVLKKNGHPWTVGKVFPDSCIIGPWLNYDAHNFLNSPFQFFLDDVLKQESFGKNMLFKPEELVCYASEFFPLCKGDILFTGTPSGVGAIQSHSVGALALDNVKYEVQWIPS